MRRQEKMITDRQVMDSIIEQAQVCRLALCDGDFPYIVPMCFGYDGQSLYLHGAAEGQKTDLMRKNPHVCVEFEVDTEFLPGVRGACSSTMRYRSVILNGTSEVINDLPERQKALGIIMEKYSDAPARFPIEAVTATQVWKIVIKTITGKQSLQRQDA